MTTFDAALDIKRLRATRPHLSWQRPLRIVLFTGLAFGSTSLILVLVRFVLVPLLVLLIPALEIQCYDYGFYGAYPEQSYVSSNATSRCVSVVRWDASCDNGLVLLALDGPSITDPQPLILDSKGNLVWTSDQFGHSANLKIQQYRGDEYLTFWAGEKLQESGRGVYYMVSYTCP